ncbi:MAG TPA: hypothetical protein GX714_15620 [Chloroflexi bacterium]|jgi:hypothetical protein|nr:hypothetical protein [Chloroflexota bacterium]
MRARRSWCIVLLLTALLALPPASILADETRPLLIDSQVLVTVGVPEADSAYGLLVQATSRLSPRYRHIITLTNLSPWTMTSLRLLNRAIPNDAAIDEIYREWYPEPIAPGESVSISFDFGEDPLPSGCHQIEISLAHGLDTILVDCGEPGTTTVWNVPLTGRMEEYLSLPALSLDEPEGRSKLGLHVTANSSPAIMEFVRDAQPAVMALIGDPSMAEAIKEASPETVVVARFLEQDQSIAGDPIERARAFVSENTERYLSFPAVDYWMGWNEPIIEGVDDMEWFAAFESERVRAMAEIGKRVAIGNFSAGCPEPDEFQAFLPALAVAQEHDGVLALHEYSAPTMSSSVGMGVPGLEAQSRGGSLTLRYRYWYDHYLRGTDMVLPLIITESGIDGGVLRGGEGAPQGWRDFAAEHAAMPSAATEWYASQLSWYDDELRRDPHVLGFAVFNAGDPSGDWASFDVTDILPQLADLVHAKG